MSAPRPTIQGWLTQPSHAGRSSEGHNTAVTVLRMVGSSHQHQAAEPVPFRTQPAPLRSIKPPRQAAPSGCTHDCSQGDHCTCAQDREDERHGMQMLSGLLLCALLLAVLLAIALL
jgi:hypothetical protein